MKRRVPSAASLGSMILTTLPWVYALLVVVCSTTAPVGEFDDALPLVHGELVQQGARPAIDFPSFYPPLGPYVTAVAFNLFGRTIVAARLLNGGLYLLLMILLRL